ncbi:MAG: peptidoglycan bridge formation glycyltransferase FemA/FemB family protein [Patescibacteria group bacterium]|nr:peptidoglycan bridge formation glycyltransferase FemA/FemB family protein [Patescibacteria group bacterium]
MELQQSPLYAEYVKRLGWHVETVDGIYVFIKRFPLFGGFAKIQRIEKFPSLDHLLRIFRTYHVRRLVLEASERLEEKAFKEFAHTLERYVPLVKNPFIPTKTLRIDLEKSEEELFHNLTQAKRRAVRRALKHGVIVTESDNIHDLIRVKNKSAGLLGFITTSGVKEIWLSFRPDNATTVLGFHNDNLVAGILLIFWHDIAYYWIAGGTKKGKQVAAPTLAAWEAIKLAKTRGMKQFDFVGIWDERFPTKNRDWLGFTKFKEGFGGKPLYYPTHY